MSDIECATVKAVTMIDERPNAPERDDEAEQEQQVVGAVEDVPEAGAYEAQRRLVPARVEPHEARVAVQLERALGAARRQEAQRRRDLRREPVKRGSDREFATCRTGSVFEAACRAAAGSSRARVLGDRAARQVRAAPVARWRTSGPTASETRPWARRGAASAPSFSNSLRLSASHSCAASPQRGLGAGEIEVSGPAPRHVDLAASPRAARGAGVRASCPRA